MHYKDHNKRYSPLPSAPVRAAAMQERFVFVWVTTLQLSAFWLRAELCLASHRAREGERIPEAWPAQTSLSLTHTQSLGELGYFTKH